MYKNLHRHLMATVLIIGAACTAVCAQTTPQEKKTDLYARKAIKFMNHNKPDSVYAMTGQAFKSQVDASLWNNLYENQLSQILPFSEVTFMKSDNGVNEYKLKSQMDLSYYVSLDGQNKLQTFLFKPYQASPPAPAAKPEHKK